jgi:outer membrane receptor protein involved in Fe transport
MLDVAPRATRWQLQLGANLVGPYSPFDAPGVTLPTYGLMHLGGGIRVGRAEIQVGVRNLLNHRYPELQAGDFVVPGQPRTVFGTIRYGFGRHSVAGGSAED